MDRPARSVPEAAPLAAPPGEFDQARQRGGVDLGGVRDVDRGGPRVQTGPLNERPPSRTRLPTEDCAGSRRSSSPQTCQATGCRSRAWRTTGPAPGGRPPCRSGRRRHSRRCGNVEQGPAPNDPRSRPWRPLGEPLRRARPENGHVGGSVAVVVAGRGNVEKVRRAQTCRQAGGPAAPNANHWAVLGRKTAISVRPSPS